MVIEVLLVLVLFQVKHLVADFLLQSQYILENRRKYGHPGGLLHVGYHVAGSAICLLVVGCDLRTLVVLLVAEALIHYHLDWTKDNLVASKSLTTTDAGFWNFLGLDQLLHQFTYIGMAWYFATSLAPG